MRITFNIPNPKAKELAEVLVKRFNPALAADAETLDAMMQSNDNIERFIQRGVKAILKGFIKDIELEKKVRKAQEEVEALAEAAFE